MIREASSKRLMPVLERKGEPPVALLVLIWESLRWRLREVDIEKFCDALSCSALRSASRCARRRHGVEFNINRGSLEP